MERAARRCCREVASIGLLTLGLAGCAAVQNPPGGPPDFQPPEILEVAPDSGTVNPDFEDELVFSFSEVVNEQSGGNLANLVRVSPRPEEIRVRWRRNRITVRPVDGWRANTVYRVTLDSGVTDLSNNIMPSGRSVVFTTGGPIPLTSLSGEVIHWETGRQGAFALIEAVLLTDSLVYTGLADSLGRFTLSAIPQGSYSVYAAIDENRNGEFDRREAFDSVALSLDSVASAGVLWAFVHDTTGPRLRAATYVDSTNFTVEFNQNVIPEEPTAGDVRLLLLPDSIPVAVAAAYLQSTRDSIVAILRAAADSALRDSLAALDSAAVDSAGVATDTVPAPIPPAQPQDTTPPDPGLVRIRDLLAQRPALERGWAITTVAPMPRGARFVVEVTARNVNGAESESRFVLITPEPEPEPVADPDSEGDESPGESEEQEIQ